MRHARHVPRFSRIKSLPWTNAWYFAPAGLSGLVAIASIPVLILAVGNEHWGQIALGQSIGLVGSVLVGLGWPVTGPSEVAQADVETQYGVLIRSLLVRLLVAGPVCAAVASSAFFLPGALNPLFIGSAIAFASLGMGSSWYFLGLHKPRALFLIDALIRGVGALLGMGLSLYFRQGFLYVCGIFGGLICSVLVTVLYAQRRAAKRSSGQFTWATLARTFRLQRNGFGLNLAYVLLCSIALPLSSFIGAHVFLVFAVIDKIQKQFVTLMLPVTQMVVGRMSGKLHARGDVGLAAAQSHRQIWLAGLVVLVGALFAGPVALNVLSVGVIRADSLTRILFAVVVFLAFMTQTLPLAVLAPLRRLEFAVAGCVAGIVVMIPSLFWWGYQFSLIGVLMSISLSFSVCLAFIVAGARSR